MPPGRSTAFPRSFYERPTLHVARDLLGCLLVHDTTEGRTAGRIVEVEAYLGPRDLAAHTARGRRTARSETMWGAAGHAYVYFTYGLHHCVNVVTRGPGVPQAVLLRALAPLEGVETMRRRRRLRADRPDAELARGPGNLTVAMGIDRGLDGVDLVGAPLRILPGERLPARAIDRGPRIGIAYAGSPWTEKPWRLWITGEPAVSGRRSALRKLRGHVRIELDLPTTRR